MFVALFAAIRKEMADDAETGLRHKSFQDLYWNPQAVIKGSETKPDLVRGIKELATDLGLSPYLPTDCDTTLTALFAYRNNMFHNGFEWPLDARKRFQSRLSAWPKDWFSQSSQDNEPWIFYMSEKFIAHCLRMIDQVLEGVGKFLEDREPKQVVQ